MAIRNWARSRWNFWITKRIPSADAITLYQRQLFVFPTSSGLSLLGLLLILLLIAINYENNLVYGLVFLLATILVITVHLTFANLYRITIKGMRNTSVFAGHAGAIEFEVTARNHRRYEICLITCDDQNLLPIVEPREPSSAMIAVTPEQRGLFALGRLKVATEYPFGLVRCWTWIDVSQALWVYPRPVNPPFFPRSALSTQSGTPLSPSQFGEDLHSFKPYRPGDAVKNIQWSSVARGAEPQVIVMADESSSKAITISFNDYPGVDLETRLSWLCARVLAASRDNLSYSLVLPSANIGPSSGERHRDEALMMLAQFDEPSE